MLNLSGKKVLKEQYKMELKMLKIFINYNGIKNCDKKLTSLIESFSISFIIMDDFLKSNQWFL